MKFHLCVLVAVALVPATLAGDQQPSSLWEFIREKVGLGVAPSPHIGGGAEATPHAFPFQAALQISFRPGAGGICGGSLIAPEWVLTAAHCVNNIHEVNVLLGSHNVFVGSEEGRQSIKGGQIFVNEEFKTQDYDIALIKLERPAQLNQYVQPIRLPSRSLGNRDLHGTPAEILGWGGYADDGSGVSHVLRHARTGILNNNACRQSYGDGIKDWRMCSDGSNKKGVCGGDSGGPLFITEEDGQRTIVGTAAFRLANGCENGTPCVFTRVTSFLDWIHRTTGLPIRN